MEIYQPAEDSYLLQKWVRRYAFGRVLDMGTGSGIQALTAVENPNVKEIIAVDINEHAVRHVEEQVTRQKLRKMKVLQGDLWEPVHGSFHTIIFNPPYLPQDKDIEDKSLYGGKKGWEVIAAFFSRAAEHLFHDGAMLLLFSSLTHKEKVEEIIFHHLFEFQELERQKLAFEELYVYLVTKSGLLRELQNKGIHDMHYVAHGHRGEVFKGMMDLTQMVKKYIPKRTLVPVAIKVERKGSVAQQRLENEAKWLAQVNQKSIGPKLLLAGERYIVMEFVEGKIIEEWMNDKKCSEVLKILRSVLEQCFVLDQLHFAKEEMHHPHKHIIITPLGEPVMIDFERSHESQNPQNVTQFVEYICRLRKELAAQGFIVPVDMLRELAKRYKEQPAKETFMVFLRALG